MTWNEVLMNIINTAFKLVITLVIPYAFSLIRAQVKNDIQAKYLAKAESLIRDAVAQVQQTYVDNMKAEDLFDEKAQDEAFKMVRDSVLNMMNDRMKSVVMDAVGDFEEWIKTIIESNVYYNKGLAIGEVIHGEVETTEKVAG